MRNPPPVPLERGKKLKWNVGSFLCTEANKRVKAKAALEHRRWNCDERDECMNEARRSLEKVFDVMAANWMKIEKQLAAGEKPIELTEGVDEIEGADPMEIMLAKRCLSLLHSPDDIVVSRAIDAIAKFKGSYAPVRSKSEKTDNRHFSLSISVDDKADVPKAIDVAATTAAEKLIDAK